MAAVRHLFAIQHQVLRIARRAAGKSNGKRPGRGGGFRKAGGSDPDRRGGRSSANSIWTSSTRWTLPWTDDRHPLRPNEKILISGRPLFHKGARGPGAHPGGSWPPWRQNVMGIDPAEGPARECSNLFCLAATSERKPRRDCPSRPSKWGRAAGFAAGPRTGCNIGKGVCRLAPLPKQRLRFEPPKSESPPFVGCSGSTRSKILRQPQPGIGCLKASSTRRFHRFVDVPFRRLGVVGSMTREVGPACSPARAMRCSAIDLRERDHGLGRGGRF